MSETTVDGTNYSDSDKLDMSAFMKELGIPDDQQSTVGLGASGQGQQDDPYAIQKGDPRFDYEAVPYGNNTDSQDHSQQLQAADGADGRTPYEGPAGDSTSISKIIDLASKAGVTAQDWIKNNPELSHSLLGGIGNAFKDKNAKEIAALHYDYLKQRQADMNNSVKSYGGIISGAMKKQG